MPMTPSNLPRETRENGAESPDTWRICARLSAALLFMVFVSACQSNAPSAGGNDENNEAAAQLADLNCAPCHGSGGVSAWPQYPRLAGQQEPYLAAQIRAFKNNTRADPEAQQYMWAMATQISDAMVDPLAHYYAGQTPAAGIAGDKNLIAEGRVIFEKGLPERGIVACASCHGKNAEGNSAFPRLAGQHSQYLIRQLGVIQKSLRNSPTMHGIIKDMRPDEMKAVATFLQSK